jgi:hypothetical protein
MGSNSITGSSLQLFKNQEITDISTWLKSSNESVVSFH